MPLQAFSSLVAKLQHFADTLNQVKLDKEVLSIIIDDKNIRSQLHNEILIYEEIIRDYHDVFKDILNR